MKKFILIAWALTPFILSAQGSNGFGSHKPQKAPATGVSIVPNVVINGQQNVQGSPAANMFTPIPFVSLNKNTAPPLPDISITRDPVTGMPILIDNIPASGLTVQGDGKQAAFKVLETISPFIGIEHASREFKILQTEKDNLGITHIKLQQTINGIEVYGAQGWLHFTPDSKVSFNGRTMPSPALASFTPLINGNEANLIVKNNVQGITVFQNFSSVDEYELRLQQFTTELVVLPGKQFGKFNLAWHVTVRPNILMRYEYFIDANTGEILNKYDNTCTLGDTAAQGVDLNGVTQSVRTFNANSKYYMIDASKSMYTGTQNTLPGPGSGMIVTLDLQNNNTQNFSYVDITSVNNSWNNPRAISAHRNAILSFDYFKATFSRNSINGKGGDVVSFINVGDEAGGSLDNAFWNGQYMFYGNGKTQFKSLAGSLDVGGHEMTHGVVQETANLEYQGESGALNESFADVFGAMIENGNWKLGEEVVQPAVFPSGCLRDMQNPHNGGNSLADNGWQPNHTNEQYTGTQDNGGVHINSGIPNHAFYLIATATSRARAQEIYYKALSNYLTKSSKFIDCRIAVLKAAADLSATANEVTIIKQSFDAVGIFDGSGTNTTPTLPNNPGGNKILFVDLDANDPNSLYLTDDNTASFTPISTTPVTHKPSVTDNGSFAVFVGADNNIYTIGLTSPFTQQKLNTPGDGLWSNVAISKDGNRIAAVTTLQDTAIYVFDAGLNQWGKYRLYNPTTAQGVNAGGVLYADAVEWDYTGQYVMYDSYNKANGQNGQFFDFWDIGVLRAWSPGNNNFGDGQIFKVYNNLPSGVNIGNPTFAKNSPYIIAFDLVDERSFPTEYYCMGANLETATDNTIFFNNTFSFPSYSPQDNRVVLNSIDNNNGNAIFGFVTLDATKIKGTSAQAKVDLAGYAQWYGTGSRQLPSGIDETVKHPLKLYPNPTNSTLNIILPDGFGSGEIEVFNLLGEKLSSVQVANDLNKTLQIDVAAYPVGTYLLRWNNGTVNRTEKFVKF